MPASRASRGSRASPCCWSSACAVSFLPRPAAPRPEGQPELFVIHAHKDSKFADGNGWHTDVSCDAEPPLGSCLQLRVLPPIGGDTLFANMHLAYERLSEQMKAFCEDLTAVHDIARVFARRLNKPYVICPAGSLPLYGRSRLLKKMYNRV